MIRGFVILAAMLLSVSTVTPPAYADPAVLPELNALRADAGRAPLRYSDRLERIARLHAEDMARNGFFAHEGSNGSTLGDRASSMGYGFCFIAENIAKGQRTRAEVMSSWEESRGHRRNMLDKRATEIGLARADGAIWVMVLGRPGC